ncbi:MAG: type IV secretion protein DotG [Rhodospirillales bacterium]|nr:type IV secretion protein DotG [Rhodospirillales bacterium]
MNDQNNMNDDLEMGIPDGDDHFEDFETGTSLGEMWRENPIVKIGIIVAVVTTVIAGIILFGGKKQTTDPSMMRAGSDVSSTPGTEEVSDVYREAVEEQNTQEVENALRQGGSALPVPITAPVGILPDVGTQDQGEDPLERWRRIQEERRLQEERQQKAMAAETASLPDPHAETIAALADAISAQMDSVLQTVEIDHMEHMFVTDPDNYFAEDEEKLAEAAAAADDEGIVEILLPAGTIEYGQLLIEANSDTPGPVLAQLVSGPLAGSRMIGDFSAEEEYLILRFSAIVIDGISYSIDAVALDPDTTGIGMATEVDHRYFRRIILPAAAAFIEGMGSAIADSGNTTVTVAGDTVAQEEENLDTREEIFKGVSEASSKLGEILDDQAQDTQTLVKVHAGTPMGILFLDPVTKEDDDTGNAGS